MRYAVYEAGGLMGKGSLIRTFRTQTAAEKFAEKKRSKTYYEKSGHTTKETHREFKVGVLT